MFKESGPSLTARLSMARIAWESGTLDKEDYIYLLNQYHQRAIANQEKRD